MWTPRHLNKTHMNLPTHMGGSDRESAKVFVAKIPYYISEEDIISKFEKYGSIVETKMLFHQDGAFRGSAFIKYASDESARKCLALDGQTVFSDETLVVRPAQDKWSYQKKKGANGFYFQNQARFPDQYQRRSPLAQLGTSSSHNSTMDSDNKMTSDGMKIPVESRPTYGASITRPKPTYLLSPGSPDTYLDRRANLYGPSAQPHSASQKTLHSYPTHYNPGLVPYTNIQNGSGLGGPAGGGAHFGGGAIISANLQIPESVPTHMMNKSSNPCMGGHPMLTATAGTTTDGHTTTTTNTPDTHSASMQPKDYPIHQARQQQQHFQTQYERQQQTQELLFGTSDEGDNGGETQLRHHHQHQYLHNHSIHTHMHPPTRQHEHHQHQNHYHHQNMFSSLDTNINNHSSINSNNTNINITINGINGALNGFNSFLPSSFNGNPPKAGDGDFCVLGGGVDPLIREFTPNGGYGFVDNTTTGTSSQHTTQLGEGEVWNYNPYCAPEFGTQKVEWQNGISQPSWPMGGPLGKCVKDFGEETKKKVAELGVKDKKADSKPFQLMTGNLPTRYGFIHFQQPPMTSEAVSEITNDKKLKQCMSF